MIRCKACEYWPQEGMLKRKCGRLTYMGSGLSIALDAGDSEQRYGVHTRGEFGCVYGIERQPKCPSCGEGSSERTLITGMPGRFCKNMGCGVLIFADYE